MEASLGGEKVSESAMYLSEAIDSDCAEARHCSCKIQPRASLMNCCNRVYVMGPCFLLFLLSATKNSDIVRNIESSLNFSWMKCKYPHMNAIVHFAGRNR